MATANSTQHLDLLGKTVHLVDHIRDPHEFRLRYRNYRHVLKVVVVDSVTAFIEQDRGGGDRSRERHNHRNHKAAVRCVKDQLGVADVVNQVHGFAEQIEVLRRIGGSHGESPV
ncbi:hypothetical protein [Pseudomonas aeruginosa]|uniref:hypothetical protein n=1 Tax=Pseudomonas aeruginosa TaxID=287 RepID=UPI0013C44DB9|nr:hypothetical protein [Pseudomonas aeruginosa]